MNYFSDQFFYGFACVMDLPIALDSKNSDIFREWFNYAYYIDRGHIVSDEFIKNEMKILKHMGSNYYNIHQGSECERRQFMMGAKGFKKLSDYYSIGNKANISCMIDCLNKYCDNEDIDIDDKKWDRLLTYINSGILLRDNNFTIKL